MAIAIFLAGLGRIGGNATDEADFLGNVAEGTGRNGLGIGVGPDANVIDDPVFFGDADLKIIGEEAVLRFGQAEIFAGAGGRAIEEEHLGGESDGEKQRGEGQEKELARHFQPGNEGEIRIHSHIFSEGSEEDNARSIRPGRCEGSGSGRVRNGGQGKAGIVTKVHCPKVSCTPVL